MGNCSSEQGQHLDDDYDAYVGKTKKIQQRAMGNCNESDNQGGGASQSLMANSPDSPGALRMLFEDSAERLQQNANAGQTTNENQSQQPARAASAAPGSEQRWQHAHPNIGSTETSSSSTQQSHGLHWRCFQQQCVCLHIAA